MSNPATKQVILKRDKDKPIRQRHHWIFSGAIAQMPKFEDGEMLAVHAANGEMLGTAYFNSKSSIIGRMVSFGKEDPFEALEKAIANAIELRQKLFDPAQTNGYRLINGEGDLLPGLIVDKYGDVFVLQISTKGIDVIKEWLVKTLKRFFPSAYFYEKSLMPSRKEEGLSDNQSWLSGKKLGDITIKENGLSFYVPVETGQKTGFFLDHREMRQMIRKLSHGKRVLNCFSYTGGFSVYALAAGATHVDSVDVSETALKSAEQNVLLNQLDVAKHSIHAVDVFEFLRNRELNYDVVVLDPPAFAKRKKDIVTACRGYKDINRIAMQKMPAGSFLLTCSCSYFVDKELFQKVAFQAAVEANRVVKIVHRHQLAADHPINICHPEGDYLKSLLLYLE